MRNGHVEEKSCDVRSTPRQSKRRPNASPTTRWTTKPSPNSGLSCGNFRPSGTAAALQAGLTPQQRQALLTIRGFSTRDPLSIGDLADFLLIQPHTAVGLVDRMTKLELISRSIRCSRRPTGAVETDQGG